MRPWHVEPTPTPHLVAILHPYLRKPWEPCMEEYRLAGSRVECSAPPSAARASSFPVAFFALPASAYLLRIWPEANSASTLRRLAIYPGHWADFQLKHPIHSTRRSPHRDPGFASWLKAAEGRDEVFPFCGGC